MSGNLSVEGGVSLWCKDSSRIIQTFYSKHRVLGPIVDPLNLNLQEEASFYLFFNGCAGSLLLHRFFLVAVRGATLPGGVRASHRGGFS